MEEEEFICIIGMLLCIVGLLIIYIGRTKSKYSRNMISLIGTILSSPSYACCVMRLLYLFI